VARISQTVYRLNMSWEVRGSNSCGGEIFCTCQEKLWGTPSLLYNGFWFFPGVKAAGLFVDRPPASSTKLKERLELYLWSPFGPWWLVRGRNFTFTLTFMYWRGKRFDLLSLIADMLYLTHYMFWDVGWGCLKTGFWGEYLGPRGTR